MARAVGNETYEISVGAVRIWADLIEKVADSFDHVQIGALVAAADVVRLACNTSLEEQAQRLGVILDIEPITDVLSVAIDGQRLAPANPLMIMCGISFSGKW